MTAYLAGLAHIRCMEHELADEIDGVARGVLAAMAYPTKESEPVCSLSHTKLAERSGFAVSSVQRAQARLEAVGLIERLPSRPKTPTKWRLVILEHGSERPIEHRSEHRSERPKLSSPPSSGVLASSVRETEDIGQSDRSHRSERPKTSVRETDNPSDPAEGLPKAGADSSAPSSPLRSAAHELSAPSPHDADVRSRALAELEASAPACFYVAEFLSQSSDSLATLDELAEALELPEATAELYIEVWPELREEFRAEALRELDVTPRPKSVA